MSEKILEMLNANIPTPAVAIASTETDDAPVKKKRAKKVAEVLPDAYEKIADSENVNCKICDKAIKRTSMTAHLATKRHLACLAAYNAAHK